MNDKPLPPVLRAAIEKFAQWSTQHLSAEDEAKKITRPLYHYTNAAGLRGIIESQKLWFTSYLHLNDPSELIHGMEAASRLLKETSGSADDGLIKMFCEIVDDLVQHGNFNEFFGFYIASLSREDNDLGQWRAYADNGRGFALGLAPHLFEEPTDHVVMPVVYGREADQRYRVAIETAAAIVQANRPHLSDKEIGIPFLREMANQLIAGQLIGISLGVKHEAYSHEKEVRLVTVGMLDNLKDHIRTRIRGSEIVPYIESEMPLLDKNGIIEIVVGPAALPSAKDGVRCLLQSFGIEAGDRIRDSGIPYRAL